MNNRQNDKLKTLFFGDSNTWGYSPLPDGSFERLKKEERYTYLASKEISKILKCKVSFIENGVNGRTVFSTDKRPGKLGYVDFYKYNKMFNKSLNMVVIMLGTNDLKDEFDNSPKEIAKAIKKLYLEKVLLQSGYECKKTKLLLIAPPKIEQKNGNVYVRAMIENKAGQLEKALFTLASSIPNCSFVSAYDLPLDIDGEHLSRQSHGQLAKKIAEQVFIAENNQKKFPEEVIVKSNKKNSKCLIRERKISDIERKFGIL